MSVLLLEDGSRLLLEDGSRLLLEDGATAPPALTPPLLWWWGDARADPGAGPLAFAATVAATPPAGHFDHVTSRGPVAPAFVSVAVVAAPPAGHFDHVTVKEVR